MNRFNFVSGGAAAVDELMKELARRETQRRQDFMDSITRRKMDLDEKQEGRFADHQKRTFEDLQLQRESQAVDRMHEDALPGDRIDPKNAALYDKHRPGVLTRIPGQIASRAIGGAAQADPTAAPLAVDETQTTSIADVEGIDEVVEHRGGTKYLADRKAAEERAAREREAATSREATARDNRESREAIAEENRKNREALAAGRASDAATAAQERRFNGLAAERARSPLMKASDRTIVLEDAAKAVQNNPNDATNQLALAYGWIQALDTYQSAVREGELQLAQSLATRWQNLAVEANRIITQGAVMSPEVAKQMARNANELIRTIDKGRMLKEREFAARAKVSGIESQWNQFMSAAGINTQPAPQQPAAPAAGAAETPEQRRQRLIQQYSTPQR